MYDRLSDILNVNIMHRKNIHYLCRQSRTVNTCDAHKYQFFLIFHCILFLGTIETIEKI